MRLLVTNQIDPRIAALLLHALRTASSNLKLTSLEPEPTTVVIDQDCVERRPLGATAWSPAVGRDYDVLQKEVLTKNDPAKGELLRESPRS